MSSYLSRVNLDKNVPIPLYYQLKRQVLALIDDSTLKEGEMLPAENELCDLLGVSRPTIRQAFSELVAEGYLQRYKGKGTFVAKPKVEDRFLSKLETFNQEMLSKGMPPHTDVLTLERFNGPHEANERLGLPLEAPLLHLVRLRSADDVPMVLVETFIPYDRYKKLMTVNFRDSSLYNSLERIYGIHIHRVRREIEAVNARSREADLLRISRGKALSQVKTLAYAEGRSDPVEFSIAQYRGDRNKFSVEVFR